MAAASPVSSLRRTRRALHACTAALLAAIAGGELRAQVPAPAQRPPVRGDSLVRTDTLRVRGDTAGAARDTAGARRGPARVRAAAAPRPGIEPPVSPRRAFLSSLLVPGLGQARLDRPSSGALFVTVELVAATLAAKAGYDLRTAKAFRSDSIAVETPVDSAGNPRPARARDEAPFGNDLVRARRLHLEDWLAVIAFNHLIAGAEAYVSANLWDLPAQVSARQTDRGPAVVLSLAW